MWFALTAHQKPRSKKESRKEFSVGQFEIILTAETRADLEAKLNESVNTYPREMQKYLEAGIKIVEAENLVHAKVRAEKENIYFDQRGQYSIF